MPLQPGRFWILLSISKRSTSYLPAANSGLDRFNYPCMRGRFFMEITPKLRVVQVGCGGMSRHWLDSACSIPGLEIVGLVDIFEEAARQRAAEQHLDTALIGNDLTSILEQCKPDPVFNCTIPEAHASTTI